MSTKFKQMLFELTEQLNFINLEMDDSIAKSEKSLELTLKAIDNLKKQFLKNKTISSDTEIDFFKNIKPKFTSLSIYHNAIFKIETKMPHGGDFITKKYLNKELKKLKRYFDNNLDFYNYHRTGSSFLDFKYFIRGSHDVKLRLDSFYFEADHSFSTSHDFKVAKILAHDLVQVYIETKILKMGKKEHKEKSQHEPKGKMIWTGSKVSLTEIMYAFHTKGVFNNGAAELKEIASYFEEIFHIDLGQYRRTFLEIRERKSDRTKFINALEYELLKRMEETDETF
ncbi:RteC domain-containing protein [Flavobacterium sp.]|uniref:RteC domain-containing protein n=1 Tax=Flavobacterium sp. TaxID=239 RepID=UPI00391AA654